MRIILYVYIFCSILYSSTFEQLNEQQDRLEQSLWFNKAVLELKNNNYQEAIFLFKKTSKFAKGPSLLNIAITRYKQKKINLSKKLFLELIEMSKKDDDLFVYLSANLYLYKITKEKVYLKNIIKYNKIIINNIDSQRRILADAYILLNKYKYAEFVLDKNEDENYYKKAILSLINQNYRKARDYFNLAKAKAFDINRKMDIAWFLIYIDLKLGEFHNINDKLAIFKDSKIKYFPNEQYNITLDVNYNISSDVYMSKIKKLDLDTKIDLVFYFTSYLFSDDAQIQYSIANSFFLLKKDMLNNLDKMTQYNKILLDSIGKDHYILRDNLKNFKYKYKKSYMHFNLGLAYANIGEYKYALDEFQTASNLKPGNTMYQLFVLLCATKTNKKLKDDKYIKSNIVKAIDSNGKAVKKLYQVLFSDEPYNKSEFKNINTRLEELTQYLACENESICQNIAFFDDIGNDYIKKLLYLSYKQEVSDVSFISNIQDNIEIPKDLYYQKPIVIKLYRDYLHAIGLESKMYNINYKTNLPSSSKILYTNDLYLNKYNKNNIQDYKVYSQKYNMTSKDSLYLLVAATIQNKDLDNEEAYINIALINRMYNDNSSSFLIGLRALEERKFKKALDKFKSPFKHEFINFRLDGLEKHIKEL